MVTVAKPKFYITTAIDYTNAPPHVGHSLQKVAADVLARWNTSLGKDVFFLTGTDEHGLNIQRAAESAGKKPKAFVDKMSKEFQDAWDLLNIKYNKFYRTTDKNHEELVKDFIKIVNEKGDIYKGTYDGRYCSACENFLNEDDIVDGKCKIHNRLPEYVKEDSYFFKLSKYQKKLLEFYEAHPKFILPETRKHEIVNRVKAGLKDLSISRTSFDWGVQFPLDKKHVTYVWFDALLNYITALDWPKGKNFKKYWPADVHLLGKDNGWFHAVIWPAMLMSAGIELPKMVYIHGFLTVGGQKISKTIGNVIDPKVLVKKYGADAYRYFMLRENSIAEDGDFSEIALIRRINTDLANSLGNLVSRTLTLIEKFSGSKIPTPGKQNIEELDLNRLFNDKLRHATEHIEKFEFHHALEQIWEFINGTNKYVNDEKPWELAKTNNSHLSTVLYNSAEAIRLISALIAPFMPETAKKIAKQVGFDVIPHLRDIEWGGLKPGTEISKGKILFEKIEIKPNETEKLIVIKKPEEIDISKLDIRVGKILEVEDFKETEKLYKIKADFGSAGERWTAAGLKPYFEKRQLKDKLIVGLLNLEPRVMRGFKSEFMTLAAVHKDEKHVELLSVKKSKIGDLVCVKGVEPKPAKQIKLEEFLKIGLKADKKGRVLCQDRPLQTNKEEIRLGRHMEAIIR